MYKHNGREIVGRALVPGICVSWSRGDEAKLNDALRRRGLRATVDQKIARARRWRTLSAQRRREERDFGFRIADCGLGKAEVKETETQQEVIMNTRADVVKRWEKLEKPRGFVGKFNERFGLNYQTLGDIKRGKSSAEMVEKFAQALAQAESGEWKFEEGGGELRIADCGLRIAEGETRRRETTDGHGGIRISEGGSRRAEGGSRKRGRSGGTADGERGSETPRDTQAGGAVPRVSVPRAVLPAVIAALEAQRDDMTMEIERLRALL